MELIDCKHVREEILNEVRGRNPGNLTLSIIHVKGDDASEVYVRNKVKTAESVGITAEVTICASDISVESLKAIIGVMSDDPGVTGVMLQLPLPDHLEQYERELLDIIPRYKDVDGLNSANVGRLWSDLPCIAPATAEGVMRLLKNDLSGCNVTVINRSNLIGKPLIKLLLDRDATVTVCHSKTRNIGRKIWGADVVITGIGKANYFNYEILDGQIWIDCSINRDENGKLCGDVDLNHNKNNTAHITPVPGGVGILTTAQLMLNVIKANEYQEEVKNED